MMPTLFMLPLSLCLSASLSASDTLSLSGESGITAVEKKQSPATWTLQDCIDYARENNLQVKSSQLDRQSADVELKTAKASRWPSLSFGSTQGFSNGSKWNEGNGNFVTDPQYTGTYNISASVTLYNGGKVNNTIKQQKVLNQASRFLVEKAQNDIELAVTASFLEVLYALESLYTDSAVLQNSLAQWEKAGIQYEEGAIRQSEYARIQAQYESDNYNYVVSQNNLRNRTLELKQLLELGPDERLEVAVPDTEALDLNRTLPAAADIYENALQNMPEIKASELRVSASEYAQKVARAQMIPSLRLSASVGTGYYTSGPFTFLNQMHNNLNENLSLGITIPIYQNRTAKSSVETAKINTEQALVDLQSQQKQLLKEIEQAWQDANSAQSRFLAASRQHEAASLSYSLVTEEYQVGGKSLVDVLTEKSTYLSSVEEMLKAKYQAVLSMRLLDFYMNRPAAF